MRSWALAKASIKCGGCPAIIDAGQCVQVIRLPHVTAVKFRCPSCAGEPVPELVVCPTPTAPAMVSLRSILPTALDSLEDWKSRQVGEDG